MPFLIIHGMLWNILCLCCFEYPAVCCRKSDVLIHGEFQVHLFNLVIAHVDFTAIW